MGLVTAFSPGPAVSRSHLAVGIYCLMLEMRRRTSEMHGLGGPEWAGALGAQRSASAALEAWLGLPTVPRSCARVGLKCTCKPVTTTVSLGQRTDRGLQYCTGYEMSASLKKRKSQLLLGIHWQPIPVSAGRGRGHRAPMELRDCGVGGHWCQH